MLALASSQTAWDSAVWMKITKAGSERIDDLEPLWKALQEHHTELMPVRAGLSARRGEQAWQLRRRKYASLLNDPPPLLW